MLFKYRKYFGALRIFFGLVFFFFPVYEMIRNASESGPDFSRWGFILFFFLLYSVSAISNGIKEINEQMPGFHLLRFFEASLNGFIAIYLLILIFSLELDFGAKFLFLLLNLVLIIAMVRDLRLISLQYYEKKKKKKK